MILIGCSKRLVLLKQIWFETSLWKNKQHIGGSRASLFCRHAEYFFKKNLFVSFEIIEACERAEKAVIIEAFSNSFFIIIETFPPVRSRCFSLKRPSVCIYFFLSKFNFSLRFFVITAAKSASQYINSSEEKFIFHCLSDSEQKKNFFIFLCSNHKAVFLLVFLMTRQKMFFFLALPFPPSFACVITYTTAVKVRHFRALRKRDGHNWHHQMFSSIAFACFCPCHRVFY